MEGHTARFDASIVDALDWKLGSGRGRRILLAMTQRRILSFHASWTILECLGGQIYETRDLSRFGQYAIRIKLAEGVEWDGETLTVPGTWPETVTNGLAGRRVMEMVDHPAIPRDRLIETVQVGSDGIVLGTTRRVVGRDDLLSPTLRGRLADHWALNVTTWRFNLTQRIHTGIGFMSLLGAVLGGMIGLLAGLLLAIATAIPLHFAGVSDGHLDAVFAAIPVCGVLGAALLYVDAHCELMVGGVNVIVDRMRGLFGRAFV